MSDFADTYFEAAAELSRAVSRERVDAMAARLADVRDGGGRLFIIGVGGGAAHASHAVNDFRKLCALESYAPSDNVAELTARTNDEGWETSYVEYLKTSRLSDKDAILVFSVGGGSREHNVSMNLVLAVEHAKEVVALICGVVGSATGTTAQLGDEVVVVDAPPALKTPLVESLQAVVWHAVITHPDLAASAGKWESVEAAAR
jgi:D-sedoheptulose 7-phosphate isomerase